jgi:hypothetical protein
MPVNTVELKNRLDAAITNRANVDATFDEIERWVGPMSGGVPAERMPRSEAEVDRERAEVWDSTAPEGADKLAANIYTSITNPAMRWARTRWRKKELRENTEANKWLETETDGVMADLADSDFYTEIASCYQDWVRYNTACFVAEALKDAMSPDQWTRLDFTAPPIRECYYEPDYAGNVLRWWRVFSWTPAQIISKHGAEKVPQRIRDMAAAVDQSSNRIKVAFAVYVRPELVGKKKQAPVAPELRPIGSVYFLCDSGEQVGDEDGYYEMPVYIVPWEKAAGSDWGHGPGMRCLPTVRYLNARLEQQRMAGEKAIDPTYAVTERGQQSDLDNRPGGRVVVGHIDDIKPLESASRFEVGERDIADLRAIIRGMFWTEELTLKISPAMTATEVNARIDQMNKLFGPTLARLYSSVLDPLLKLVFAMRYRAGRMAPMPAVVKQAVLAAGGDFDIEYQGPLARAQRIDEVAAIEREAAFNAAGMKMGFTEAKFTFNFAAAARRIGELLGTPAEIRRSEQEVKAMIDGERKMMAQAQQAEVARAQGEAVQQRADAAAAMQSVPAQPMPLVSPEAGGGLM